MEFRQTVLVDDVTPAADGTLWYDLPINALSHIIFTVKCLNLSADTKATLAQILGAIENVQITRFGSAIMSLSGTDLYALNCILLGKEPWQENVTGLENSTRHLTLIIPGGRKLFNPSECFPPTTRGELRLGITVDIADTGYDGLILQIETVELPEASPAKHLKCTTIAPAAPVVGPNDCPLPIEQVYVGVLLWGTTIPTGTAWTTTLDDVTLLVNNVERYYRQVNWESLHGALIYRLTPAHAWDDHWHLHGATDVGPAEQDDSDISNHAFLDFDPAQDDQFLLDSAGLSSLSLRITAGDTNVYRVLPVELIAAGG